MDKLRKALTLANSRRMGFDREMAVAISHRWMENFEDLFRQDRADSLFSSAPTDVSGVPAVLDERCLLLTAHYGGYTAQFIALSKHTGRPISIIVGPYPQSFCDMLKDTCAKSGVDMTTIRSGMRMLRQINTALDEGRIVASLFDVPWHRGSGAGRTMTAYPFGAGMIQGSDAMFELAARLELPTHLIMHVRRGDGFALRFQKNASQADCYAALADEFMRSPADFERLCELHKYSQQAKPVPEAVLFSAKERHFALSVNSLKAYEFDLKSDIFVGLDDAQDIDGAKLVALEKASGLKHELLAAI